MIPPERKNIPPLTYKKIEKLCFRVNSKDVDFSLMTTKSKASLPLSEKSTNHYISHSTGPSNLQSGYNQHPQYYDNNSGQDYPLTTHSSGGRPMSHGKGQKKHFDCKQYKLDGMQRDKEFYSGARKRLVDMYKDIAANPDKQVSGLKKAKTRYKIPRIKHNKDELSRLLLDVVTQEKDRYIRKDLSTKEVYMPAVINGTFPANLKFADPHLFKNEKLVKKVGLQWAELDKMKLEQTLLNRLLIREGRRVRVLTGQKKGVKYGKQKATDSQEDSKHRVQTSGFMPGENIKIVEEVPEVYEQENDRSAEKIEANNQAGWDEEQGGDGGWRSACDIDQFNEGQEGLAEGGKRSLNFNEKTH
jgi:hypothetical protein